MKVDPEPIQEPTRCIPLRWPEQHGEKPFWPSFDSRPPGTRLVSGIDTETRSKIRQCVLGLSPWPLVLVGQAGVGKTCAAASVIDTYGGWFSEAAQFVDRVEQARQGLLWFPPPNGTRCRIDDFWNCWASQFVCALDDIGSRKCTEAQYEIIKHALTLRDFAPMIVTSNLGLAALTQAYDERIASRLAAGTVVRVEGKDRRLSNTNANAEDTRR